jgi:c-di-GMP-binding flagellar brake protein YcgR
MKEGKKEVLFMDLIDVENIKENDIIKLINPNKTLAVAVIKKVSNDCLGITINVKQDTYVDLYTKQVIELILIYGNEAMRCSSVILGIKQNGFEQVIIITIPELIFRIQRRKFERVATVLDIEYSTLPDIGMEYKNLSNVEQRYFRCFRSSYTLDISAGGIQIVIPKEEINSKFALVNLLIKDEKIIILCRKMRSDAMNDFKHNRVAFKYEDIKEQHRQLICDFVSEKTKEINNV